METRAHHVLIGLFTLIVVLTAMFFAMWLGKSGHDKQFDTYDIVFGEAVTGLSKGSTVEFNGIKIGEISYLWLDKQDPRRVYARVRIDSAAPVRSDTKARMVMTGLTGTSVIRLSSGNDPKGTPLPHKDGEVPVIVATPSPMNKLLTDGEDVIYNANEMLRQARNVLSPENIDSIGKTLKHLEQTTETLAMQRDDMREAIKQLAKATAQANIAFAETSRLMQAGNRLIDKDGRQTLLKAQAALASVEKTMQSVEKTVSDNRGRIDRGMDGFSDVGPAVAELRSTLASLKSVTRQLEDQPANYLLGRDQVKEFTP